MKKLFVTSIACVLSLFIILFSSCASTTVIHTSPSGAKVYIDGEYAGTTPYTYRDTKVLGSITNLQLEKKNYSTLYTSFSRDERLDVGAIVGGLFVGVPFLWTLRYKPAHRYELTPISDSTAQKKTLTQSTSQADKLRELKSLLDEKIITQEEFDKEKKKILEEGL